MMQCSEIWSDVFNQTHVCDEEEGHDTPHLCHCGWEEQQVGISLSSDPAPREGK